MGNHVVDVVNRNTNGVKNFMQQQRVLAIAAFWMARELVNIRAPGSWPFG